MHVHRIPDGEWIGIRAETNYGPDGIGTTIGTLFDESGAVGAIQQSVLVRPMPALTARIPNTKTTVLSQVQWPWRRWATRLRASELSIDLRRRPV